MSKTLLFGATGGCGSQALKHLLERGQPCVAIVRDKTRLPAAYQDHTLLQVVVAPDGHLILNDAELERHLADCNSVISCVGHTLSFRGIFGKPKDLCVETTRRVCEAIQRLKPASPVKYIVVSTEGVDRPDGLDPQRGGVGERCVLWILEQLLPPHIDNVKNAAYLHKKVSGTNNPFVEFCAVRPSSMIDGDETQYTLHEVLQNGIFNAGKTTRANVGCFMADLVTKPDVWAQWNEKWPQILNVPK